MTDPEELITNPVYEKPLSITTPEIAYLENLIKEDNTLFPGYIATTFTKPVTLSATVVSNMYVAGMISAEATLAANVGVDLAAAVNGQDFFKLKLLISGRFKIMA